MGEGEQKLWISWSLPPPPRAMRAGQKLPKIDKFSKSFFSTTAQLRENWIHGDVEQEGLYQNCEIYNPRGSGFAPRAEPNMIYT
jgi:hypothetical protein